MTSKETGASEHALINLIYRHLKENGYKKAASALKQHVSQVPSTNMNKSLEDIFKKWLSEEQEKKLDEGKAPKTASESTTDAARNSKPEKKTPAVAKQQRKKRPKTETCISSSAVKDHNSGEDSDSDSSLDVEKWKRMALELSDADFAKMDAVLTIGTSTDKSTTKRKPARPKKQQSPKRTKVKTATSLTKTDKKKTTTKKKTSSSSESDKITTPCNEAVPAETNERGPESKTASNLLDQVATTAVSNGLSEIDGTYLKHQKKHSLSKSHDTQTPSKKAEIENAEPKLTSSQCKKTKSKKNLPTPERFETPSKVADAEIAIQVSQCGSDLIVHSKSGQTKAKKDKSKKATIVEPVGEDTFIQTDNEDATGSLSSDQSKINRVLDFNHGDNPSKKAKSKKSKKSKELRETGDVAKPSEECDIAVNHSNQHQTEDLPVSVKKSESFAESDKAEKHSKKSKKSLSETNEKFEIQAATSMLEPLSSETPSKKSKTKNRKASEADQVDPPSQRAVVDVGAGEATTNTFQSDQTDNSFKKSKRKRTDSRGDNVTFSTTENASEGQNNSLISAGNSTNGQGQECVLAVDEEGTPGPKKRKKNKKDKEKKNSVSDENVEEVQPPPSPAAEECADSLPSSQKKKKKKKHKHREEEVPPVSTPAPEEDSPKKKKKSSKKKKHTDVSEQELI